MKVPEAEYIWMDGRLVPWRDANVHVVNQTLQYGWGVYEGIRAYRTDRGTAAFRLDAHLDRLTRSAAMYGMTVPFTRDELTAAVGELVAANGLQACYLRPLVHTESGDIGMDVGGGPLRVLIAAWRWDQFLGADASQSGIRVCVSSWRRVPGSALPLGGKACGIYLNSMLARAEAKRNGYDEAVLLNTEDDVADACVENVFVVEDGRVITPPLSDGPLPGITRSTVLELARRRGFEVAERTVTRTDLLCANEIFLTGTAAEVVPVVEVDGTPIGRGVPGPVAMQLVRDYQDTVTGRLDVEPTWLTYLTGVPDGQLEPIA